MSDTAGKPRLLVLTTTFPRWPNDHEPPFVFELAKRLTERFDVTVLAPHAAGAAPHEEMAGLDVHRFRYAPDRLEKLAYEGGIPTKLKHRPWLALLIPTFFLAQLAAAFRLVREQQPTLIHAHWLIPSGLVGAILKDLLRGRRRLVVTSHGADLQIGGGRISRWLKREAAGSADAVTVVSRAMRDDATTLLPAGPTVEIAPMGVDLQTRFTPQTSRNMDDVLVFVGRLVEKKGVGDLIAAMPAIRAKRPAARALIVGHGPLGDQLRSQAAVLGVADSVSFVGRKANSELPGVLRGASIAVLPFCVADNGDVEGLGLAAVEAMGCGLPVIVGNVPAIHDVVSHGETGWIVPQKDPVALAEAILSLMEDHDQADALARNGREFVSEQFDWSAASARYARLFERLID